MKMICINCPKGCELDVERAADGSTTVAGHACPRGEEYGRALSALDGFDGAPARESANDAFAEFPEEIGTPVFADPDIPLVDEERDRPGLPFHRCLVV